MSKMSEIHIEFTELGADEIYKYECQINEVRNNVTTAQIVEQLTDGTLGPSLSRNAVHLLVAGAKTHEVSKMLERTSDNA